MLFPWNDAKAHRRLRGLPSPRSCSAPSTARNRRMLTMSTLQSSRLAAPSERSLPPPLCLGRLWSTPTSAFRHHVVLSQGKLFALPMPSPDGTGSGKRWPSLAGQRSVSAAAASFIATLSSRWHGPIERRQRTLNEMTCSFGAASDGNESGMHSDGWASAYDINSVSSC